jgi:hypothetical protein
MARAALFDAKRPLQALTAMTSALVGQHEAALLSTAPDAIGEFRRELREMQDTARSSGAAQSFTRSSGYDPIHDKQVLETIDNTASRTAKLRALSALLSDSGPVNALRLQAMTEAELSAEIAKLRSTIPTSDVMTVGAAV